MKPLTILWIMLLLLIAHTVSTKGAECERCVFEVKFCEKCLEHRTPRCMVKCLRKLTTCVSKHCPDGP
ncbi:hypothetical protein EG68_10142 [Paragonimus skrjabini miyazakii]|uniref:Uncharacterized protein n=1 Tax=Paragonimus skrjabini miyazakii TaxID=59628 RepID=A0A8S9YN20_9TREM|nr:hypothetical protein EG68_10142 [Paragonimus skrjabini miyazakii]